MSSETGGTIRTDNREFALFVVLVSAAGWMASNRVGVSSGEAEQVHGVASHGDAPDATRQEVLARFARASRRLSETRL